MAYVPPAKDNIDYVLSGIVTHDFLHLLLDLLTGNTPSVARLEKAMYKEEVALMTDNKILSILFDMARGGDINNPELHHFLKDYLLSEILISHNLLPNREANNE